MPEDPEETDNRATDEHSISSLSQWLRDPPPSDFFLPAADQSCIREDYGQNQQVGSIGQRLTAKRGK